MTINTNNINDDEFVEVQEQYFSVTPEQLLARKLRVCAAGDKLEYNPDHDVMFSVVVDLGSYPAQCQESRSISILC